MAAGKAQLEARRVSLAVSAVLAPEDGGGADGGGGGGGGGGDGGDGGGGSGGGEARDAEEVRLCGVLQAAKERYHFEAETLKRLKTQCTALQGRVDGLRAASQAAFAYWWPLACEQAGLPCEHAGRPTLTVGAPDPPPPAPPPPSLPPSTTTTAHGSSPREAWGDAPAATTSAAASSSAAAAAAASVTSGGGGAMGSTTWLAVLSEPEAALAEFRQHHWDASRVRGARGARGCQWVP